MGSNPTQKAEPIMIQIIQPAMRVAVPAFKTALPHIIKATVKIGTELAETAAIRYFIDRAFGAPEFVEKERPRRKIAHELLFFGNSVWHTIKICAVPTALIVIGGMLAPVSPGWSTAFLVGGVSLLIANLYVDYKRGETRYQRAEKKPDVKVEEKADKPKTETQRSWSELKAAAKKLWRSKPLAPAEEATVTPLKVVKDDDGVTPETHDLWNEFNDASEAERDAKVAALIDVLLEKDIRSNPKEAGRLLAQRMPDDIVSLEKGRTALDAWRKKSVLSRSESDLMFNGYGEVMAVRIADIRKRQA